MESFDPLHADGSPGFHDLHQVEAQPAAKDLHLWILRPVVVAAAATLLPDLAVLQLEAGLAGPAGKVTVDAGANSLLSI